MRFKFKNKKVLREDTFIKRFAFMPKRMPSGDIIWLEFYKVRGYWFYGPISGKIIFNEQEIIDK